MKIKTREIYSSDLSRQCKMEKKNCPWEKRPHNKAEVKSQHKERDEVYLKKDEEGVKGDRRKHLTLWPNQRPKFKTVKCFKLKGTRKTSHNFWQCYKPKPPAKPSIRPELCFYRPLWQVKWFNVYHFKRLPKAQQVCQSRNVNNQKTLPLVLS